MSGGLRELAVIQHDAGTGKTSFGGNSPTWEEYTRVMVDEEQLRGNELAIAHQIVGSNAITLRMRFQDGVKPSMRVQVNGRTLEIVAVTDLDRRRMWQRLTCREIV